MKRHFSLAILIPVFGAVGCIEERGFVETESDAAVPEQWTGWNPCFTFNCFGRECGDDGCGGLCGYCQENQTCGYDDGLCYGPCRCEKQDGVCNGTIMSDVLCLDNYFLHCSDDQYQQQSARFEAEKELSCADGLDNDCDGAIDCADLDCFGPPFCPRETSSEFCHDYDGQRYCTVGLCSDGYDNDNDGATDCEDVNDCATDWTCANEVPEVGHCDDGIDNDWDSRTDCRDSDCDHYPCNGGHGACEVRKCVAFPHALPSGEWTPATSAPVVVPEGCGIPELPCNLSGPTFSWPPDTGQASCYNARQFIACPRPDNAIGANCQTTAYCGQDAQYGWDVSYPGWDDYRFAVSGPTSEEIVTDTLTGLVWQKETSLSFPELSSPGSIDWQTAISYCKTLEYADRYDWRLPDRFELQSLVNYGRRDPSSDFPGMLVDGFWSSSSFVGNPSLHWYVDFVDGYVGYVDHPVKGNDYLARCVAVGWPAISSPRFYRQESIADQPVVFDTYTGLLWQGDNLSADEGLNWKQALEFCERLSYGGRSDWRLPNVFELSGIVELTRKNPAMDPLAFPSLSLTWFWSSSSCIGDSGDAFGVSFDDGHVGMDSKGCDDAAARCVTGGLKDRSSML